VDAAAILANAAAFKGVRVLSTPLPLAQFTTRIAYGARQLPRVAWYAGHSLVMRRLADMVREREGEPRKRHASRSSLLIPLVL
jgi:hypothetical protein